MVFINFRAFGGGESKLPSSDVMIPNGAVAGEQPAAPELTSRTRTTMIVTDLFPRAIVTLQVGNQTAGWGGPKMCQSHLHHCLDSPSCLATPVGPAPCSLMPGFSRLLPTSAEHGAAPFLPDMELP